MIDHIGVKVKDIKKSRAFYEAALKPLGYVAMMDFGEAIGFGAPPKPDFWIGTAPEGGWTGTTPGGSAHVAFAAKDRAAVDAFHKAAVAAGGKDNGAPGVRAHYHPSYYGAFVIDPDGNNVEAVCHLPG